MKDLLENLKIARMKARFKRALAPDKAFLRSARHNFLNSIDASRPVRSVSYRYNFMRLSYAFMVALIVVAGTGSLAAFADYKDVSPANPLYTLKRASEQTRLALAPAEEKSVVHVALAERRLKELEEIQLETKKTGPAPGLEIAAEHVASVSAKQSLRSAPASASAEATVLPIAEKLSSDIREEVEKAFSAQASISYEKKKERDEKREDNKERLCRALDEAVRKGAIGPRRAQILEERCDSED